VISSDQLTQCTCTVQNYTFHFIAKQKGNLVMNKFDSSVYSTS